MKNINYYGQKITVSDEVAEFLEQDRLRESAQRRSGQRHLDFVGNEIYTMPGLFTDEPTDTYIVPPAQHIKISRIHN